jgi:hypothetical protein
MFKILSTYSFKNIYIYIKCNIWRVAIRPSYIWDARFLKVNMLTVLVGLSLVIVEVSLPLIGHTTIVSKPLTSYQPVAQTRHADNTRYPHETNDQSNSRSQKASGRRFAGIDDVSAPLYWH